MSEPVRRRATYEDVLAAPVRKVAEILDGELVLNPRPALPHTVAASALGEELGPPFKRGRGGPGGWLILDEPELHLGADILVPDLGAWRRERLPAVPREPYLTLAPDWVCEVLSPSTELELVRRLGFPFRVPFVIAMVLVWNGLFVLERAWHIGTFVWGPFAFLALATVFAVSLLVRRAGWLQRVALKAPECLPRVRGILNLITLTTGGLLLFGFMFILAG
jgi:hypothetical protein